MAFQAALWDPLWAPSSGLAMLEGCYKVMKSEDVIVKSEGTLHTSLIDNQTGITYCTCTVNIYRYKALGANATLHCGPGGLPNLTVYIMYVFRWG